MVSRAFGKTTKRGNGEVGISVKCMPSVCLLESTPISHID